MSKITEILDVILAEEIHIAISKTFYQQPYIEEFYKEFYNRLDIIKEKLGI